MKKIVLISLIVILVLALVIGVAVSWANTNTREKGFLGFIAMLRGEDRKKLLDDWQYEHTVDDEDICLSSSKGRGAVCYSAESAVANPGSLASNDGTIGLSTGGAKNINNFRENIKNGYFPISTDITYNGLFYDYYFNTGNNAGEKKNELFYPAYSTAISKDPVSGAPEYYMTVGLNSNIKESDFKRKKLNIVVVLDISGSMSSSFNSYYYDGKNGEGKDEERKSKMQIANESVNLLLDKLNDDDRVGIVLFDNSAYLAKPLGLVGETDMDAIKKHVLEIKAQGGTNFDAGYKKGTELISKEMLEDPEYENRIIVITDAMPNMGETSRDELVKDIKKNADNKIYTSFIGVGVDFNTAVIETLSDVRGSNYYSVHSSEEFKKIMSEDFEYMVTPLVFDLELKLVSNEYEISAVYGTDTRDKNSGTLMKVNTLFPSSRNESGEAKGGIILLKVKPLAYTTGYDNEKSQNTKIVVSYKDREGNEHKNEQEVSFKNTAEEYYDNTGIRKGIALTRYANLMKNWILYERGEENRTFVIDVDTGIKDCEYSKEQIVVMLGENERSSVKLAVSNKYKEIFKEFKKYFENEMKEIGDSEMSQEIEILNLLQ